MKVIVDFKKIDKSKWGDFVKNHPEGNIFQTPQLFEVYQHTKNYNPIIIAVVDENENIEAILLAVIQKETSGILGMMTARSIIYGGPLYNPENTSALDLLLNGYLNLIGNRAIYSQVRNFFIQNDLQKNTFTKYGFVFEEHLNILVDLTIGVDELWKRTKRNRKDGIIKGNKQGFVFNVNDKIDSTNAFYKLLKESYTHIKLPIPNESLFRHLNSQNISNLKWFVLEYNSEPKIILCAFEFKKVLSAFFIGICQDSDFLKLRPVDFFYWEVIKWAAETGLNTFDWMGAGKPNKEYGVRNFKLQYGGEVLNTGRLEKIHKPLLFFIGKLGLKIWQKLGK